MRNWKAKIFNKKTARPNISEEDIIHEMEEAKYLFKKDLIFNRIAFYNLFKKI